MKHLLSLLVIISTLVPLNAQNGKLVAGPMQGHTTPTSTKIWVMVKNAEMVSVNLKAVPKPDGPTFTLQQTLSENITDKDTYKKYAPLTFEFKKLYKGVTYHLSIAVDGEEVLSNHIIELAKAEQQDFSFLLGSCALSIPNYMNWMHPGIEDRIYKRMITKEGDFMLWLGDYLYYRKRHSNSKEGMMKKHVHTRLGSRLNNFLITRPQYSIWDDHDYGPNNSDGSFVGRDDALDVLRTFFPNPHFGVPEAKGCFFQYDYLDASFFMLDSRFHKTLPNDTVPTMLGKVQLEWLKQELRESDATFKFIGVGSQVLNQVSVHETLGQFKSEMDDLMSFIESNKIKGVIFLTGDRHHSELLKVTSPGGYPYYDFTCSPITSFRRRTRRTSEKNNPDRIEGTLADYQNFGRIEIKGEQANRVCVLETYNKRGKLIWEYEIAANEWDQID